MPTVLDASLASKPSSAMMETQGQNPCYSLPQILALVAGVLTVDASSTQTYSTDSTLLTHSTAGPGAVLSPLNTNGTGLDIFGTAVVWLIVRLYLMYTALQAYLN
jgi:hypothetical protein